MRPGGQQWQHHTSRGMCWSISVQPLKLRGGEDEPPAPAAASHSPEQHCPAAFLGLSKGRAESSQELQFMLDVKRDLQSIKPILFSRIKKKLQ